MRSRTFRITTLDPMRAAAPSRRMAVAGNKAYAIESFVDGEVCG
jgi:hypothetical protein